MTPERIARLLPAAWTMPLGDVESEHARLLGGILTVMSTLHERTEAQLDRLDALVDPLRTPPEFLPMLTAWLDLDRYLRWPSGREDLGRAYLPTSTERLRQLCLHAPSLRQRRGLAPALAEFIEIATGVMGVSVLENAGGQRFHVAVQVPAAAEVYADLVAQIVAEERPAHLTWSVEFVAGEAIAGEAIAGTAPAGGEEDG
jgi:hypothetical protein